MTKTSPFRVCGNKQGACINRRLVCLFLQDDMSNVDFQFIALLSNMDDAAQW